MKAYWLLEQLQYLPDDFDTHDALDLVRRNCRGHSSSPSPAPERPVTLKKMSGKLNRLCCMRFLVRTKVKRVAFTRNGHQCFRGYKYLYRITKQGHSYIRYRAARAKSGYYGSDGNVAFNNQASPPARSGTEEMISLLMLSSILRTSQTTDQLTWALAEEQEKNRRLYANARRDASFSAFIASAKNAITIRNNAIIILRDVLIRTANMRNDRFSDEFWQYIERLVEIATNPPIWMK